MYRTPLIVVVIACGVLCSPVSAQMTAQGDEFQVNTHSQGAEIQPAVTDRAPNGFVIIWTADHSTGPVSEWLDGQRYNSSGSPAGSEFTVIGGAGDYYFERRRPDVDGDPAGGFTVVWESTYIIGGGVPDILGRRMTWDGQTVGLAFAVNTVTTYSQINPQVAVQPDGDFLVVWQSDYTSGPASNRIKGQLFTSNATKVGSEFHISQGAEYTYNTEPAVDVFPGGAFLVVWEQAPQSGSSQTEIVGRMVSSAGAVATSEFQINIITTGEQGRPDVAAISATQATVVWDTPGDFLSSNILSRFVHSSGVPLAGEFEVVHSQYYQYAKGPSVAMTPSEQFVVAWDDSYFFDANVGVRGRLMNNDGSQASASFAVNTYVSNTQNNVEVAVDSSGHAMVAWDSDGSVGPDLFGRSIAARNYTGLANAPFFSDGFESGTMSAWSSVGP